MPKRKADAWPINLASDPDILSVDENGKFVLCKVCHCHYALHGGKKPKPVMMNSVFRTRAWEVHKQRTNCHRSQNENYEFYKKIRMQEDDQSQSTQKHQTSNTSESCATSSSSISSKGRPVVGVEQAGKRPIEEVELITYMRSNKHMANNRASLIVGAPDFSHNKHVPEKSKPSSAAVRAEPFNQSQSENLERWRIIHEGVARALDLTHTNNRMQSVNYHTKDFLHPSIMDKDTVSTQAEKECHNIKSSDTSDDVNRQIGESMQPYRSQSTGSEQAKQYWGTLRDLYKADQADTRKILSPIHSSSDSAQSNSIKDAITEFGDQISMKCAADSNDLIEAHESSDHSLVNAIDRLTGVVSKHLFAKCTTDVLDKRSVLNQMLMEINAMRSHQESCLTRLLQLGERHVEVLEEMLECKLRKENRAGTKVSRLEEK